jgi:predicted small lipoprotein YifL
MRVFFVLVTLLALSGMQAACGKRGALSLPAPSVERAGN